MRIAICLSGQPRTWRATLPSLKRFFAGHQLDVFVHTWREGDPAEIEALLGAYQPVAHLIEARPDFTAQKRLLAARFPQRPALPIFDMIHGLSASLDLAVARGGYDLLVRARFDAMFDGVWSGEAPADGMIVVPRGYPDPRGCNDQFALGRPGDMALLTGLLSWFGGALPHLNGPAFAPEVVLRVYLEAICGLKVVETDIAMRLCREGQEGRAFSELQDCVLFHAEKHEQWQAFAEAAFPDLAAEVDFHHDGRTALVLDRALESWLQDRSSEEAARLLSSPWPQRVRAVDAFITSQAGALGSLDEDSYRSVRLMCAMLLQRMKRGEPMCPESFLVHALSANVNDMRKAAEWGEADIHRLEPLKDVVRGLGPLALALEHAPPFEQEPIGLWREA